MVCLIKFVIGSNILKINSGITDSINHNFKKIRIYSYNSLPIVKILAFHNVIIHIKPVVNRNKNKYYCKIFLEKMFI